MPYCSITVAETAADSATTEPTEMSNSPEIMTIVMPAATISGTAIWPIRLAMLIQLRKRGDSDRHHDDQHQQHRQRLDQAVGLAQQLARAAARAGLPVKATLKPPSSR